VSEAAHLAAVKRDAQTLAASLLAANEAGVAPALVVPTLIGVFREAWGPLDPAMLSQLGAFARGG
jgi:hypothetical protein